MHQGKQRTDQSVTGRPMRPYPRNGFMARAAVLVTVSAMLLVMLANGGSFSPPPAALAQAETPAVGSTVRVANTDGQRLHLRAGPSMADAIIARLPPGETLVVTGAVQVSGSTRWLPVQTAAGQRGWVSAAYVVVVASASPTATRTATTPTPTASQAQAASAAAASARSEGRSSAPDNDNTTNARPVEVEAKLKYPELDGRDQEITVWVTRDGAPVAGAIVTLETNDGDDDERFRQLDPTNAEGWTRRVFDVRHEKGTVELQVEAVAPDGGEGRTIVSYFRR